MQTTFESLNDTGKKVAGFVFVVFILCACLVLHLIFSFISNIKEHDAQPTQNNANWVKPQQIVREEKQKVKSFWSLKLTFEKGGSDE